VAREVGHALLRLQGRGRREGKGGREAWGEWEGCG
jgi:hypothetical protein